MNIHTHIDTHIYAHINTNILRLHKHLHIHYIIYYHKLHMKYIPKQYRNKLIQANIKHILYDEYINRSIPWVHGELVYTNKI